MSTNEELAKARVDWYQKAVARMEALPNPELLARLVGKARLLHGMTGVQTESGEIADAIKRHIWYGQPLDEDNLKEEIGDLLWYIALICNVLDLGMGDAMLANVRKLKTRYKGGGFTQNEAIERDIEAEKEALGVEALKRMRDKDAKWVQEELIRRQIDDEVS